jgi:hypothetical protein
MFGRLKETEKRCVSDPAKHTQRSQALSCRHTFEHGATLVYAKNFQGIRLDFLRRSRRESHNWDTRIALAEHAQPLVVGAERVAPGAHAVRFVDDEPSKQPALCQAAQHIVQPAGVHQLLWRHVQQLQRWLRFPKLAQNRLVLPRALLGRQVRRRDALGARRTAHQGRHLVLDERQERAAYHRHASSEHRGKLVAQAFAAARRHQHENVPAG